MTIIFHAGTPQLLNEGVASITFDNDYPGINRVGGFLAAGSGPTFGNNFLTGITINGVTVPRIAESFRNFSPNVAAYFYLLVAPASGTRSCVVTSNNPNYKCFVVPFSAENVDQTTPLYPQQSGNYNFWTEDVSSPNASFEHGLACPVGGYAIDVVAGQNVAVTPPQPRYGTAMMTDGAWFGRAMASYQLNTTGSLAALLTGWNCFGETAFAGINFALNPAGGVVPQVPNAPTIGTAVAGDAQISVFGAPPSIVGSAPINLYRATLSPGGTTFTSATLPVVCSPVTNGVAKTATLAASNNGGSTWSAESVASNSVTPSAGGVPRMSSVFRF